MKKDDHDPDNIGEDITERDFHIIATLHTFHILIISLFLELYWASCPIQFHLFLPQWIPFLSKCAPFITDFQKRCIFSVYYRVCFLFSDAFIFSFYPPFGKRGNKIWIEEKLLVAWLLNAGEEQFCRLAAMHSIGFLRIKKFDQLDNFMLLPTFTIWSLNFLFCQS